METIKILNEKYKQSNISELLTGLANEFSGRVAFSSSLGVEDQVITYFVTKEPLPIRIFTLDTGRMFPETYEVLEKTQRKYKLPIQIFFPDYHRVEAMVSEKGVNLFYESIENRKLCCHYRKIEPLQRALQHTSVWITGLRAEQSANRSQMELFEWDENHRLIKVNPLIHWTLEEVWNFVKKNNIPYNSLHDQSFPSIGCQPCTIAVKEGDDFRSGRWWWEQGKKECGLHSK